MAAPQNATHSTMLCGQAAMPLWSSNTRLDGLGRAPLEWSQSTRSTEVLLTASTVWVRGFAAAPAAAIAGTVRSRSELAVAASR